MEMNNDNNDDSRGMSFGITPEIAVGEYSNLVSIVHSPTDFVIDFARMLPGLTQPQVRSRIVMSPEHAKRMLIALHDNVMRYESRFGQIAIHDQQAPDAAPFAKGNGEA